MGEMKKVYGCVCLTAFLFATMEVALKVAGADMDGFQMTFLRFAMGGILLLPFAVVEMKKEHTKLSFKEWIWLLATGCMGIPISMAMFQFGVLNCNAATASVLISVNPLFTVLIAHFALGEFINTKKILAMLIALVGIFMMIRPWDVQTGNTPKGILLMLGAAITFSVYTVMGKKCTKTMGVMTQTSLSFLLGSGVLLVMMLIMGRPVVAGVAENLPLVLYCGIMITGVGYWSYFTAIKKSDASTGSIAFLIKPAIAPIIAVIVLHETLLWNAILGIVLLLAGSILNLRENKLAAATVGKKEAKAADEELERKDRLHR